MKTPSSTRLFPLLGICSVLLLAGCQSAVSSICNRAVECEYIAEDDLDECKSDLNNAIDEEELSLESVSDCDKCASENSCGVDTYVDCADVCADVGGYIFGANIN